MIVIKCPSCGYKQFCTHDECDNAETVICRNCQAVVKTDLHFLSAQPLKPHRVIEWWEQLSSDDQGAILERAGVLRHQLHGYDDAEAWVAAMEERLMNDEALHDFFEPEQDDDFVKAG